MALLSCQNLSIGYEGKSVLQGLHFEVFAGNYLCIVGENGSGKSTLMKTLLGLQPPIGGSILTGDGLQRNEIGYLPQQTQVQRDFPASVREIVLSGCQRPLRPGGPFTIEAEKRLAAGDISAKCLGWKHFAGPVLSGALRRSAAAGAAGPGSVRDPENAASG